MWCGVVGVALGYGQIRAVPDRSCVSAFGLHSTGQGQEISSGRVHRVEYHSGERYLVLYRNGWQEG